MKKLLILGAGIEQLPGIKQAKLMGLYVIAFDYNPQAPGFEYCDEHYVISTIDIDKAVEKASELLPDGVITLASDMPMRTVAAIGEKLGLRTIDSQTAIRATDKGIMRRALEEHGVPIPEYHTVNCESDFLCVAQKFIDRDTRFICKPTDNAASRGVVLCDKTTNLENAYKYCKDSSRKGTIIVEEYMEGYEVSVETIAEDGIVHVIAITDKLTSGAPNFVELGHSQPSMLSKEIQETIVDIAVKANKAIGIENGPSHTEIIVTKQGPKIVELGARLGGDNINTHLVPLSTGVSIVECVIRCALGEPINYLPKYSKGAAIRFFEGKPGVVKSIRGIDTAKSLTGVITVDSYVNIGDKTDYLHSSDERLGCVVAQADNAEEAINLCEEAKKSIVFDIV